MWGQARLYFVPYIVRLFVDDLVQALNDEDKGVVLGDSMLTALLYANDIVLTSPNDIVHFRRKCKGCTRSKFIFTYQGKTIQYASQYKYLGLLFNEHLQWDKAVEAILCKANRALAILNYKVKACGGLHFRSYSMLFNQLVVPVIMSNACIWGHKEYKEVLRIQYNAMRFLLGVGKACPIVGLFGETLISYN